MTKVLWTIPTCSVCHNPINIETTKTDEDGKPVHEDCHVQLLASLHDPPGPEHAE